MPSTLALSSLQGVWEHGIFHQRDLHVVDKLMGEGDSKLVHVYIKPGVTGVTGVPLPTLAFCTRVSNRYARM